MLIPAELQVITGISIFQEFPCGPKLHTGSNRLLFWFSPIQKLNHLQEGRNLLQVRS